MNNNKLHQSSTGSTSSIIKKSFFWTSIQQFFTIGIRFISTIILARLLTPNDYGLIAIVTIFISMSNVFVDSGMAGSLISQKKVSDTDYSTLFLYNLCMSLFLYIILFLISPYISTIYNINILTNLIRVIGITIIINSLCIVQHIKLYRDLNFKALAIITVISEITSLIIAIVLAYHGFGVWSLVMQLVSVSLCSVIGLYAYNRYIPLFYFSYKSFKEQFKFGINLLIARFLKIGSDNISSNIIAKIAAPSIAGYYNQANKLCNIPINLSMTILDKAIYPIFSKIENIDSLKEKNIKLSKILYYLLLPVFFILSFCSHQIIAIILGEQWDDSSWMFQILIFAGIPAIINTLCRNVLKSRRNTRQILKNDIINSIITTISFIIAIPLGIKYFLYGFVFSQCLSCVWIMYTISKEINYKITNHIKIITPIILISLVSYILLGFCMSNIHVVNEYLYVILSFTIYYVFIICLFCLFYNKSLKRICYFVKKFKT